MTHELDTGTTDRQTDTLDAARDHEVPTTRASVGHTPDGDIELQVKYAIDAPAPDALERLTHWLTDAPGSDDDVRDVYVDHRDGETTGTVTWVWSR